MTDANVVTLRREMTGRRRGPTHEVTSSGEKAVADEVRVARAIARSNTYRLIDLIAELRRVDRLDAIVEVLDDAAGIRLAARDYAGARELIEASFEFDTQQEGRLRAERWYRLAVALDGCGDVDGSRQACARAVGLAEIDGESELATRAILQYVVPGHWHAGMSHVHELLGAVQPMNPSARDQTVLGAVQAIVDFRSAVSESGPGQQFAGIRRPAAPQALAERVLAASRELDAEAQCVAHLAWRATHNDSTVLAERRIVSTSAVELAESVGHPSLRLEACVWLAIDSLESGDRRGFDLGVSTAVRVASDDGNPRLRWRAATTAAGAAHLDGRLDDAVRLRRVAREAGEQARIPSVTAVDLLLGAQEALRRDEPPMLSDALYDDESPLLASPSARAVLAVLFARRGDTERAASCAHGALRMVDAESSQLFVGTRVADAATLIGDDHLASAALSLLAPWSQHVAVSSNGWWVDGPVSLWLGELHHQLGDAGAAWRHLLVAEPVAAQIGDVRSMERAARLRLVLPDHADGAWVTVDGAGLTSFEVQTLELLGSGATNAEIAARFHYSVSTIRRTTSSIYRKLGVRSRSQAVAQALRLGIIPTA